MTKKIILPIILFSSVVFLSACTLKDQNEIKEVNSSPTPTVVSVSDEALLQQLNQDKDLDFTSDFKQLETEIK